MFELLELVVFIILYEIVDHLYVFCHQELIEFAWLVSFSRWWCISADSSRDCRIIQDINFITCIVHAVRWACVNVLKAKSTSCIQFIMVI